MRPVAAAADSRQHHTNNTQVCLLYIRDLKLIRIFALHCKISVSRGLHYFLQMIKYIILLNNVIGLLLLTLDIHVQQIYSTYLSPLTHTKKINKLVQVVSGEL